MAKVKGQGTESTTDSRDKVGMDGGGGRGRAVGVVEGRAEQEQGGHDGQAVKHIAEAKERQARLRVESRDEVCKGVTSSMRHRFVDDLRSLNSTEAWILGVLISIMVGLIVFLAYLGWFCTLASVMEVRERERERERESDMRDSCITWSCYGEGDRGHRVQ